MPTRMRVYLDTSVISAYFDDRDRIRQELTQSCWARWHAFELTISQHVIAELEATRDVALRQQMLALTEPLVVLPWQDEMNSLVDSYVEAGAFSATLRPDAQHVAAAVASGVPVLLSWNFRHLVNRTRRFHVNLVNAREGYGQIEIIAPPELEGV